MFDIYLQLYLYNGQVKTHLKSVASGLYQPIVRLQQPPSLVMSQHSKGRINELVLGQMSGIVNAMDCGPKATNIEVSLCKCSWRFSRAAYLSSISVHSCY